MPRNEIATDNKNLLNLNLHGERGNVLALPEMNLIAIDVSNETSIWRAHFPFESEDPQKDLMETAMDGHQKYSNPQDHRPNIPHLIAALHERGGTDVADRIQDVFAVDTADVLDAKVQRTMDVVETKVEKIMKDARENDEAVKKDRDRAQELREGRHPYRLSLLFLDMSEDERSRAQEKSLRRTARKYEQEIFRGIKLNSVLNKT